VPALASGNPFRGNAKGVFVCLCVGLTAGCAPRDMRASPPSSDIAAARAAGAGDVRVRGTVTVATGTFDEGFALQDASGGVYMIRSPGGPYAMGERVEVEGSVTRKDGGLVIAPRVARRGGSGAVPAATRVTTGRPGAAAEGRLIDITGRVVRGPENDLPWGWKLWLDDGSGEALVFVSAAARIDVSAIRAGQQLGVTGLGARYEQHFEILPRRPADLRAVTR
jgi:hypothetical protein